MQPLTSPVHHLGDGSPVHGFGCCAAILIRTLVQEARSVEEGPAVAVAGDARPDAPVVVSGDDAPRSMAESVASPTSPVANPLPLLAEGAAAAVESLGALASLPESAAGGVEGSNVEERVEDDRGRTVVLEGALADGTPVDDAVAARAEEDRAEAEAAWSAVDGHAAASGLAEEEAKGQEVAAALSAPPEAPVSSEAPARDEDRAQVSSEGSGASEDASVPAETSAHVEAERPRASDGAVAVRCSIVVLSVPIDRLTLCMSCCYYYPFDMVRPALINQDPRAEKKRKDKKKKGPKVYSVSLSLPPTHPPSAP